MQKHFKNFITKFIYVYLLSICLTKESLSMENIPKELQLKVLLETPKNISLKMLLQELSKFSLVSQYIDEQLQNNNGITEFIIDRYLANRAPELIIEDLIEILNIPRKNEIFNFIHLTTNEFIRVPTSNEVVNFTDMNLEDSIILIDALSEGKISGISGKLIDNLLNRKEFLSIFAQQIKLKIIKESNKYFINFNQTPFYNTMSKLFELAIYNDKTYLLKVLLLANDIDINEQLTEFGETLLHDAISLHRFNCIKILLEAGADVNKKNQRQSTINKSIINELNPDNCTPLQRALLMPRPSYKWPYNLENHKNIIKMLLQYPIADDLQSIKRILIKLYQNGIDEVNQILKEYSIDLIFNRNLNSPNTQKRAELKKILSVVHIPGLIEQSLEYFLSTTYSYKWVLITIENFLES